VILGVMVLSVAVFANDAEAAGLVWRAINKAGSLISDLGDVAGGCSNGQVLQYQTSNSTFICQTNTGFTNFASSPQQTATLITSNSSNSAVLKTLLQGTGITITNGSQAVTIASSITQGFTNLTPITTSGNTLVQGNSSNNGVLKNLVAGTGISLANNTNDITITNTVTDTTKVNSSPQTTATIITDNSTSGVTLKTLLQGTGITITNGSQAVTIASSITQGFTNITPVETASSNSTLIVSNSSNTMILKNLSGINGIQIDNGTNTLILNYTKLITLSSNVTSTANNTETRVFTIPLTASSGNTVSGVLSSSTILAGLAPVYAFNVTQATSKGWCHVTSPNTITGDAIDNILLATAGLATGTAETTWLAGVEEAQMINFDCSIMTGGTPGNLQVWLRGEAVSGNTPKVTTIAGSYYIKTP
jgi:hypothetical protein